MSKPLEVGTEVRYGYPAGGKHQLDGSLGIIKEVFRKGTYDKNLHCYLIDWFMGPVMTDRIFKDIHGQLHFSQLVLQPHEQYKYDPSQQGDREEDI